MNQKLVFVTGAGRGIGREIALKLSRDGYTVTGCSRTLKELEETRKLSEGKIRIATLDVTQFKEVEHWLESEIKATNLKPWALVVSAGTYGAIGAFADASFEEWEQGIQLNLIAPAFITRAFARILMKEKIMGRIVLLSGGGATQPLPHFSNYCAAKSAIVRFAETVAHELKPHGISINTIAPGAINTRFLDDVLTAGPEKAGKEMYEKALKQRNANTTGPDKAADLVAYLLDTAHPSVTGRLISAVWDNWNTFQEKWSEISNTDWYTLKRNTPSST